MIEPMPEPGECWESVTVCPENYRISTHGRIWSRPRNTTAGGIMKQTADKDGRRLVTLTLNGRQRTYLVHRLVLEAFVGPRPEGLEGCHGDGDPGNNYLTNLRWDTHAANMQDMVEHGRSSSLNTTHCPADHEYTPENTYVYQGRRFCRECARARGREFWRAKHAEDDRAPVQATCPECGEAFEKSRHSRRVYCTTGCLQAHWREARRKRPA